MATLTIRLQDDQHERLKAMAKRRNISLNKLFEEFSTMALSEFDTETRFLVRASRGNVKQGLKLLEKLDRHYHS